jgi:hypothetical protein
VVLPSGQKLTFGLLAIITLKVISLHVYAPFTALLPFHKCILEVMFCDGVQHHGTAQRQPFGFIFNQRSRKKEAWVRDYSHVVFV